MKAIVAPTYGSPDILEVQDRPKPSPQANEILVKTQAASINAADWHLMRGKPLLMRLAFGLRQPKYAIMGADVSGIVEAIGSEVTHFKLGDAVFGDLSNNGFGSCAEYVCAPETAFALKPEHLSFAEAAAVPLAGITALQALHKGSLKPGQHILINGASGGVGSFAIQFAKAMGAHVTAVCSSRNLEQAINLGADEVIDYTKKDFTTNGQRYDLIIAANGYHPIGHYKRVLKTNGCYVMVGGSNSQMFQGVVLGPLHSLTSKKTLTSLFAKSNQRDLQTLKALLEAYTLKPVIEQEYTLAQTADAIRHVETGHARGKIVVQIDSAA